VLKPPMLQPCAHTSSHAVHKTLALAPLTHSLPNTRRPNQQPTSSDVSRCQSYNAPNIATPRYHVRTASQQHHLIAFCRSCCHHRLPTNLVATVPFTSGSPHNCLHPHTTTASSSDRRRGDRNREDSDIVCRRQICQC
jgi:hypothetical protein